MVDRRPVAKHRVRQPCGTPQSVPAQKMSWGVYLERSEAWGTLFLLEPDLPLGDLFELIGVQNADPASFDLDDAGLAQLV